MSGRLNDLEQEIIRIMSNRVIARWTDIKSDVDDRFKKQYSGSGFDVVLSRSLKRLVEKKILWKKGRGGYVISGKGSVLADKIVAGLGVEDVYRDEVLAFSGVLQRLRDEAIIWAESDSVEEYFRVFRESVVSLDVRRFVEEKRLYDVIIDSDEDPLSLVSLVDSG